HTPQFSVEEFPLLPTNFVPSWRTPPSKVWGEDTKTRPQTTGGINFPVDTAARDTWLSFHDNCPSRLHMTQIRNLSQRSINTGLIPKHLLDGTLPCVGKRGSSLDYFKPSVRPVTSPSVQMGHQFRLIREPPVGNLQVYKAGGILPDSPVRVVRYTLKDQAHMKKSAVKNPRGISRNVLGGYYTS
ncbi:unnamed protein product, partial [Choristocarpus tenellus]